MRQGLDSKGSRLSRAQQSAELVSYITSHIRPGLQIKQCLNVLLDVDYSFAQAMIAGPHGREV